jgi:TolA-binding protein
MDQFVIPSDAPLWALLTYFLLKEGFAVLKQWLPLRAKDKEREDKAREAAQTRERSLDEREIAVLESLAQNLTTMNERISHMETSQQTVLQMANHTNQALAILIDRVGRPAPEVPSKS